MKTEWNTFTNEARVRILTTIAMIERRGLKANTDSYIRNLEANPLKGGIPAMASAPIMKKIIVHFIRWPRPPIRFRSLVPTW